uniref:Uncharacterized protein n=1 Tax=Xenopus tropicalis TaxID=8364 RepID=A0A6I8S3F7_XENTR
GGQGKRSKLTASGGVNMGHFRANVAPHKFICRFMTREKSVANDSGNMTGLFIHVFTMSSDTPSLHFFTSCTAPVRALRRESLALLVSCFASFVKFSLCSRVTLKNVNGTMLIIKIRILKFLVKSSLRFSSMLFISCFTSSRLIMSSTRAAFRFTLA